MPCPSVDSLVDCLNRLYEDRKFLDHTAHACLKRAIDPMYQWGTIAEQFDEAFQEVMAASMQMEVSAVEEPVGAVRAPVRV
jgi:glycosyltransferase involved in cell wall biosynthesis